MTVSIVSLAARGEGEISVAFEIRSGEHCQREQFLITAELCAELGLRVGACGPDCYDAVSRGAELCSAIKRGLYLLGYGSCSERALQRKLVGKGFSSEIASEAVAELCQRGYLDPRSDAAREAERCVAKLWGRRRIVATLYRKGYDQEVVEYALACLEDDGVDFAQLCAERLRRASGALPTDADDRRRLIASLERNGFSFSEIREAFSIVAQED